VPTAEENSEAIDLGDVLGAERDDSHEVLVLYIPDRDRDGSELGNQRQWVLEAASLLAAIGGGSARKHSWRTSETCVSSFTASVVLRGRERSP